MLIDDLPRLTSEERDALDGGYIALAGVPATRVPRLRGQRQRQLIDKAAEPSASNTRPA